MSCMKEKIFSEECYKLLKKVPKGKVTTYKNIAEALGNKSYRAVGNAMNKNPYATVPCHRVVKSNGAIGGFAKGERKKIKMLKQEGISVKNGKLNLDKYFYDLNKLVSPAKINLSDFFMP